MEIKRMRLEDIPIEEMVRWSFGEIKRIPGNIKKNNNKIHVELVSGKGKPGNKFYLPRSEIVEILIPT